MNNPTPPTASRRSDGLTPLALAAGLAIGHIVRAMSEQAAIGGETLAVALFFVAAASAATVCGLHAFAGRKRDARPDARIGGWIAAVGAGLLAAMGPGLV